MSTQNDEVVRLSQLLIRSGCLYGKGSELKPSKTGAFVYHLGRDEERLRQTQTERMGQFFRDVVRHLDAEACRWLGIDNATLDLVQITNPTKMPNTVYFGLDLCGLPPVINDLNPDRAVIVGYQPEIAEAFAEVYPNLKERFRSFYDGLLEVVKDYSRRKEKVFVLTEEDDPHAVAYLRFSERFGFRIGDIHQFRPRGTELVLRCLKSREILDAQEKYRDLITALKSGLPMINPLGSFLGGNKGWLTLLRTKGIIPDSWFPDSRLIRGGQILTPNGKVTTIDQETEDSILGQRKRLILKKTFSAGGREVYIGADLKAWEWQTLWQKIRSGEEPWSLEWLQPRNEVEIAVGDWENTGAAIEVVPRKLNLIQRIYAVGLQGFPTFYAEVFGKSGWKVNASGYSFPVAFD